mmetsp:Transcript_31765/g.81034  ORF Transcript_31765/g.81034 Transcript_31765/m.81034 type:complete len:172 (+) Transcript_31765:70-585(+)
MEKQPVSAQPLLSNGARGQKGATAVADAVESPRTAGFDLWEDAQPEKDVRCCSRCCGVSWRFGVVLVAALSVAAVGGFFLFSHRTICAGPSRPPSLFASHELSSFRITPCTEKPEPATGSKAIGKSSCGASPGCAHLVGECCPTKEGMLLACCSDDHAPPAPPPAPPSPPP